MPLLHTWQALLHLSEAPWSQYIPALCKEALLPERSRHWDSSCTACSATLSTALLIEPVFVTYQWLVGTLQVIAGLGVVLLIVELSFKTAKRDSWFTKRYFPILNVVLASEWLHSLALLSSKSLVQLPCVESETLHHLTLRCVRRFVSGGHERSQCGVRPTHVACPHTPVVQAANTPGCGALCNAEPTGALN
jgi:hypothetical protein